jgi:hypothetical protein
MLRVIEELMQRHDYPEPVTTYDIREEQRDLFDTTTHGRVPLEVTVCLSAPHFVDSAQCVFGHS